MLEARYKNSLIFFFFFHIFLMVKGEAFSASQTIVFISLKPYYWIGWVLILSISIGCFRAMMLTPTHIGFSKVCYLIALNFK